MKFKDFNYERPDYDKNSKQLTELLDQLEKADNKDDFLKVFFALQDINDHIDEMSTIAFIRHSIDTKDEFYDKEDEYWNEIRPMYEVFSNRQSKILVNCPFKEELYDDIPLPIFKQAEYGIKTFDEKIIPLLQQENKLSSEYGKLKASAQIEFDGQTYNLSTISPLTQDTDRDLRKRAFEAKMKFYSDNEKEFDRIYDELVKVRDKIAKELGFESYIELGYLRMLRLDYDAKMVEAYRKQILEDIVPSAQKLYARQAKRLGLDKLAYYDESVEFLSGNPKPKGSHDELIEAASKMYHEMSKETGEFIDIMINDEMWDLKSKDGKQMGGYCSSIPVINLPFIFANFNGTSGDVDVLTHEAGHAFQYYMSRNIKVSYAQWPTMESAEIHSMSMEFNAWPWMNLFFKEDEQKYKFLHLGSAIKFLPYGVLIDHFQHEVYAHPEYTPEQRKAVYRELEKQYLPHKNYEDCEILEKGAYWFQQGHVFESPFYYIDYTLAQVCALQFWTRNYNHDPNAWKDYLHLCSLGGTKTFTELVKEANLKVPFDEGCVKDVVKAVDEYLDNVDDMKL